MPAEHVHFVDHVDLVAAGHRCIHDLLEQLGHVFDAAIRGGVHLDVIGESPLLDRDAGTAHPAWPGTDADFTVQRARQDARDGGLADTAGSGEQIGMMQSAGVQRVSQRSDHMLLADQRLERSRAPLTGKDLMGHLGRRLRARWAR